MIMVEYSASLFDPATAAGTFCLERLRDAIPNSQSHAEDASIVLSG